MFCNFLKGFLFDQLGLNPSSNATNLYSGDDPLYFFKYILFGSRTTQLWSTLHVPLPPFPPSSLDSQGIVMYKVLKLHIKKTQHAEYEESRCWNQCNTILEMSCNEKGKSVRRRLFSLRRRRQHIEIHVQTLSFLADSQSSIHICVLLELHSLGNKARNTSALRKGSGSLSYLLFWNILPMHGPN